MNKPIETLQENASNFFDKVSTKHASVMECKAGCSKCCYTDISIFEVEAELIIDWYKKQTIEQRDLLKVKWNEKGEKGACHFLYDNKCTIYPARPIICRTQGLPLHLSSTNSLDYCALNFKNIDPPKEDWLNLERLNTLLAFAAKSESRDKRIKLKKLKDELLNLPAI